MLLPGRYLVQPLGCKTTSYKPSISFWRWVEKLKGKKKEWKNDTKSTFVSSFISSLLVSPTKKTLFLQFSEKFQDFELQCLYWHWSMMMVTVVENKWLSLSLLCFNFEVISSRLPFVLHGKYFKQYTRINWKKLRKT